MYSPKVVSHAASPSRKRSPPSKAGTDAPGKYANRINKLNKLNGEANQIKDNQYSSLIKTIPKEKHEIQRMLAQFEKEVNLNNQLKRESIDNKNLKDTSAAQYSSL